MVMKKIASRLLLGLVSCMSVVAMMSMLNSPIVDTVYADIEDDVASSYSEGSGNDDALGNIANQPISPDDEGVIDWLTGQRNLTPEQLETASKTMKPVTTVLGYITGGIIVLTVAGVTVITALDLMYIAIPPVRGLLYNGASGTGGGMMNGMSGGMYGGMYGGRMGGMGASQATQQKPIQWVSDEAIACAALLDGGGQQGGTMSGGMMYGGMGAMQNSPQQGTMKSVLGTYFKKRVFFILLLAVCIVVLTSSAVMDCGVNLAAWVLKVFSLINNKL